MEAGKSTETGVLFDFRHWIGGFSNTQEVAIDGFQQMASSIPVCSSMIGSCAAIRIEQH
ncbi:unnamed protein product [Fusarium graminearum]|uniref:Chromosome 3, complete genome n=1 Tax=Gibberella zeae (strain ATCC MYA-4620 / CBS 123657 / FGSC 9075 / NRRL 31084 / PH-1) TaxID=229533 RepID=A0A0E0SMV1_GIBZE|nr:hypothetical protein FG05_35202 [Fusarium graminearum]CEF87764.1 unnamed protein product [Fusarium graminearum]CZS84320.1 unnamed protein product [Fusarium graminearum]